MQVGPLHAEALAALHARSFAQPWDAAAFTTLLGQPGVAAWLSDQHGFIVIRAVADEAEILTLAVEPARRRKGIAAALLQHASATLQQAGGKKLYLEVAADNAAALALYARHGFIVTGRRAQYYAHGADALTMTRALD
jgi:ribosomal-protein-alanine N-acetyltransferase